MNQDRIAGWLTILLLFAPVFEAAAAESYPSRPVRMIIPSSAGGITDILGRILAQKLSDSLGQQVVIDNRPGASGIVGSHIVAKSAPDGYTLLMVFPSHVVNPSLFSSMPYDTVKAFAPVTLVSQVSPVGEGDQGSRDQDGVMRVEGRGSRDEGRGTRDEGCSVRVNQIVS